MQQGFRSFRLCLQQKFELGSIEVHGRRVLLSPEKEYRPLIHPPLSKRGPKRGGMEEPVRHSQLSMPAQKRPLMASKFRIELHRTNWRASVQRNADRLVGRTYRGETKRA